MDFLFTREQIRGKIIRFALWVLAMWILYVGYHFFSEDIRENRAPDSIWNSNVARFILRELVVYTFGFMGYFYLKREKFHPNYALQFWILLAVFDLFCLLIGLYRQFIAEVEFLHDIYNRIIEVIASPIYVICFGIYALYFSSQEANETTR
jgi:hypothetical protein